MENWKYYFYSGEILNNFGKVLGTFSGVLPAQDGYEAYHKVLDLQKEEFMKGRQINHSDFCLYIKALNIVE